MTFSVRISMEKTEQKKIIEPEMNDKEAREMKGRKIRRNEERRQYTVSPLSR